MARAAKSAKAAAPVEDAEILPPLAEPEAPKSADERAEEAIARALGAAEAALDATEEATRLADGTRKEIAALARKHARAQTLSLVGAGVAVFAVLVGGLVFLRSVGDLRATAATQAAANEVMVKNLLEFGKGVEELRAATEGSDVAFAEMKTQIVADLAKLTETAASAQPNVAEAVSAGMQTGLDGLKTDLLAANSELELALTQTLAAGGAAVPPELLPLMTDIRAMLDNLGKAAPAAATAASKPTEKPKTGGTTRPKAKPVEAPNPFHFP
jgi:hypothetical protein